MTAIAKTDADVPPAVTAQTTSEPKGPNALPARCGLIAIVGKPNVGKSTLLNALVGQKISITSRKAQTTRHRITGVRSLGSTQFIFVDTPGFQTRHANALNRSLNRSVLGVVNDVDLVLFVAEAGRFNQADAKVLALLNKDIPALLIANKLDQVERRADLAPWLQEMQHRHAFAEFVPMSAKNAKDVDRLFVICERFLPLQPWLYAADELTDRSERFLASEMVREKLFRLTGDELPYTSTVVIDKFEEEAGRKGQKRLVKMLRRSWSSVTGTRPWLSATRASASSVSAPRRGLNWNPCSTPRSSSSCGSRFAPDGRTTKRGCAVLVTTNRLSASGQQAHFGRAGLCTPPQ